MIRYLTNKSSVSYGDMFLKLKQGECRGRGFLMGGYVGRYLLCYIGLFLLLSLIGSLLGLEGGLVETVLAGYCSALLPGHAFVKDHSRNPSSAERSRFAAIATIFIACIFLTFESVAFLLAEDSVREMAIKLLPQSLAVLAICLVLNYFLARSAFLSGAQGNIEKIQKDKDVKK